MEGEEMGWACQDPSFLRGSGKEDSRAGGIRRPIWLGRGRQSDVVITHRSTLLRAVWPSRVKGARGSQLFTGTIFRRSHRGTNTPRHLVSSKGLLECVEPLPLLLPLEGRTHFLGDRPCPQHFRHLDCLLQRGHPWLRTRQAPYTLRS